jgi:hypothetical protein
VRRWRQSWWILLTLVPLGLMGWGALVYAGVRARRRLWVGFGLLYLALVILAFVFSSVDDNDDDRGLEDWAGAIILVVWAATFVHALVIRNAYLDRLEVLEELDPAEDRARRREEARRIAREDPARAVELGIGRPDVSHAFDGDLIDVNNAPAASIALLPGVDDGLAARIVRVREEIGGFSSLDDLGHVLGLAAPQLDRIRRDAVVLPRV